MHMVIKEPKYAAKDLVSTPFWKNGEKTNKKKTQEIAQSFSVSHKRTRRRIGIVLRKRMCGEVDECVFVSVSEAGPTEPSQGP